MYMYIDIIIWILIKLPHHIIIIVQVRHCYDHVTVRYKSVTFIITCTLVNGF